MDGALDLGAQGHFDVMGAAAGLDEVVGGLDTENLVGQSISFNGVFLIRTFNEPGDINVSEIVITPVQLTVGG